MPTPNELYQEAKCFLCYGMTQAQALKIALLVRQVTQRDPDADVTAEGLLTSASCYNCYAQGSMFDLFELALLDILSTSECPPPGETDGLIWGPTPETAVDLAASNDSFSTALTSLTGISYTTLSFGNPTHVTNSVNFATNTTLTDITFRLLESVGNDFNFTTNVLTSCSAPLLQTVGGNVNFGSSSNLISLMFPLLVSIGGDLTLSNSPNLVSLTVTSLISVAGGCDFETNNLATLDLPELVTSGAGLSANGSPVVSFSAPKWVPTDGASITFIGCALNETSVNHILSRCVAAGLTTSIINLSGGTSAAPSGQGILDKATLIGNGCTVTTN